MGGKGRLPTEVATVGREREETFETRNYAFGSSFLAFFFEGLSRRLERHAGVDPINSIPPSRNDHFHRFAKWECETGRRRHISP